MTDTERPVRVLVAEDDFLVCDAIVAILKHLEYEVVGTARDGDEAIEMTEVRTPDVVLMDIDMPRRDGIEAARAIQERCPTPIVVMTAYESPELVRRASEAGVGAYLTKPPVAASIRQAVVVARARHGDLMRLRRLNAELSAALEEVKTLRGILPICSFCKRVRDDEVYWQQVDSYLTRHTEAQVSHSLCPDCAAREYPDLDLPTGE